MSPFREKICKKKRRAPYKSRDLQRYDRGLGEPGIVKNE